MLYVAGPPCQPFSGLNMAYRGKAKKRETFDESSVRCNLGHALQILHLSQRHRVNCSSEGPLLDALKHIQKRQLFFFLEEILGKRRVDRCQFIWLTSPVTSHQIILHTTWHSKGSLFAAVWKRLLSIMWNVSVTLLVGFPRPVACQLTCPHSKCLC